MSYLAYEFKKAFNNKWFMGAFAIMTLLAVASTIGAKAFFDEAYAGQVAQSNVADPDFPMISMFTYLLFTRSDQPASEVFYILFPLAAVLPYSWSLCAEKNSSYLKNIFTRIERKHYLVAKSIATFSSSFTVIAIPLTLNVIITACLIPAFETDISAVLYNGIDSSRLWSSVFYNQPVAYCALFILLSSAFSGLWACVVQKIGAFIPHPDKLIAGSYLILYCFQALEEKFQACIQASTTGNLSLSPLEFIRGATSTSSQTSELSFIPWIVLLFGVWLVFLLLKKNRDEL